MPYRCRKDRLRNSQREEDASMMLVHRATGADEDDEGPGSPGPSGVAGAGFDPATVGL